MKSTKYIFIALLGIVIIILAPQLAGVEESLKLLKQANFFYLLLILASLALIYLSAAKLNQRILSQIGHKLPFYDMFRLAMMSVFAIHLLPVGALGGATMEWFYLKKRQYNNAQILLLFVLRTIFIYLAFGLIFFTSILFVNPNTNLSETERVIIYSIVSVAILFFLYLIYIYKNRKLYFKRFHQLMRIYRAFQRIFKKSDKPADNSDEIAQEIFTNTHHFTKSWSNSLPIAIYGLLYWIGDLMCLYFAFHSLGAHISIGVLIFAYSISVLLSIASFVPGGIGVMEASLSLIFIGLGVPSAVAVMAVLIYRLFVFWALIPLGAWAYRSLSRMNGGIISS